MRVRFSNRLIAATWCLIVSCALTGPLQAETGLLYEITRPGLATSYLLGTMHSDDPAVVAIAERIAPQLRAADRVVLEMTLDADTRLQASQGMMLPPDEHLADLVTAELFQALTVAARERGLPSMLVGRLKPWALALTLSLPPRQGAFLDEVVAQQAERSGKPITGLESAAEQLLAFDAMPLPLQLDLLRQTLRSRPAFEQQWQALQDAYLARDLEQLQALSAEQMAAMDAATRHWFDEQVINVRNRRMRVRLLPLLRKEACFIAVGALHLPGEGGLLAGLRKAGFTVRARW